MVPLNTPASSQLPKQPKSLRKQEPIQKPGTQTVKILRQVRPESHISLLSSRKASTIRNIMLASGLIMQTANHLT